MHLYGFITSTTFHSPYIYIVFYNALDSVGMLLKLGDSQHSIIHITGKKNQINHVEKGHSRSREVHLHPNTVASIRSSIYVSDNDEELSI